MGVKLASKAFSPESKLADPKITTGEQVAVQYLYMRLEYGFEWPLDALLAAA